MPGRLRTASRPSRTWIDSAPYSVSTAWLVLPEVTAPATASAASAGISAGASVGGAVGNALVGHA